MSVWTWIEEISPKGPNLVKIIWRILHGHSSTTRDTIDLDSFSRAHQVLVSRLWNFWIISFEIRVMSVLNEFNLGPILRPIWWVPSITWTPEKQYTLILFLWLKHGYRHWVILKWFKVLTQKGTFEPLFSKFHHSYGLPCFCSYCQDVGRFLLNPPRSMSHKFNKKIL